MTPLSESTYLVLLALHDEPLHGYGIIKRIEQVSGGQFIIAPGTLYGVLNNLQAQKLIETLKQEQDSRKKRTYTITPKGLEVLGEERSRLRRMMRFTQQVLGNEEDEHE